MLISSDAVKRDIMEFSLMLISSDAANRCHSILSDVNVVRCRKAAIIECHEMLTSSDVEKKLSWNSHCLYRYRTTAINEYSLMLILSDAGNIRHLNFVWCQYRQIHQNSYHWIFSDVNIIRGRKTDTTEVDLMLTSSDAKKPELLKFLWCLYEQMQKKIYYWSFLMLISSDAEKQELLNYVWCQHHQMQ